MTCFLTHGVVANSVHTADATQLDSYAQSTADASASASAVCIVFGINSQSSGIIV